MSAWKKVKLSDLGEVNRGRSRFRPRSSPHLYGGTYPFIQTGDIKQANGRITAHSQTYNEAGLSQSRLWPANTMVITIAANIAETAILSYPACFPDSVIGFIADPEKADVQFIEYLFRFYKRKIQDENVGTGSVQDNINLQTIDQLALYVPELPEQKAIASILSALDDKIELNRQMNETLEAMARAIFKDWFVGFGPTRAKQARRAAYLPDHLWSLFPEAIDEETGLPMGWAVKQLKEVCDKITDGSHCSPKSTEFGYPMASVKDMHNWGFDLNKCRTISEEDYIKLVKNGCQPNKGDVLIAKDNSYLKHIFVVSDKMELVILCSIAILRPNKLINPQILAFILKDESTLSRLSNYVSGAVVQRILLRDFRNFLIQVPPINLQNAWKEKVENCIQQCWNNINENEALSSLRDRLLPKLMSGEVRVKDADKLVDAAG